MNEIIVGNIGVVYRGSDKQAQKAFTFYKKRSRESTGRAAGESVTWLRNGEIHKEFVGVAKE